MASVNKVILVANLGRDVELRYLPSGDAIATLRVATTDKYKDKNGDKQEATEWHTVVFFGKIAEICGQYLKKGSQIYVEGSLRTRKWQDKDGNDRYSTEVRGDKMQMLGGRPNGGDRAGDRGESGSRSDTANSYASASQGSSRTPPQGGGGAHGGGGFDDQEDDIPFLENDADRDVLGRRFERRIRSRA